MGVAGVSRQRDPVLGSQGPGLRVLGLRHGFDGGMAIELGELSLSPGALVVLTGASGSGKSTLLYLLSGLIAPQAGQVLWGGTDLARLSERARDRWRRQNAGFVFQDFHLLTELSPLQNVLIPAGFGRFSARALRGRAETLLARFGVPARPRAAVLSRGEQQRTALARALLGDPAILFADEPTASLDAGAGREVADCLHQLADEGRLIIAASHDPALIARADLRLHLAHGRIGGAP